MNLYRFWQVITVKYIISSYGIPPVPKGFQDSKWRFSPQPFGEPSCWREPSTDPKMRQVEKETPTPPKKKRNHREKKHAKPGNLGCFMDEFCNVFAQKINKQHPTRATCMMCCFIRGKARWILVILEAPIAVKDRFMLRFDAFSRAQVQRHVAVDSGNSIGRPWKGLMAYPPGNF